MLVSNLPPEILDAVIDELHGDKKSLLQASLACMAFYPRTRVHLFSVASLSGKFDCDRLRELITLSPKLALHFKSLRVTFMYPLTNVPLPGVYEALTVIESLINITHLSLRGGDWCYMPDSVVSSLQSRSYRTFNISLHFHFRSIGEICSLVKNSPDLQDAHIMCQNSWITEECDLNHSLHFTPAPCAVHVHINGSQDYSDSAGTLLKSILSSGPCPFSCSNTQTLSITLPDGSTAVPQYLNEYLARSRSSLKHLHMTHIRPGPQAASSETLDVSGVEQIAITVLRAAPPVDRASHMLEWWISNLAAVNEHCAIRSITLTISAFYPQHEEAHPPLDWEDLWRRLDGCLSSSKMSFLDRVAITFKPRPTKWDAFKTRMEGNFPGLKELGCEVALNAVEYS
ncbi:hypothetical protein DFS33DRAFT_519418 [Desarmillaria ectypa]|nr:hypothetical protein DFS33DRAFT_519418 [Desarmillaria ectypa]